MGSLAERVGFEPTVGLHPQQFSRLSQSATLAPLPGTQQTSRARLIGGGHAAGNWADAPLSIDSPDRVAITRPIRGKGPLLPRTLF